MLQVEIKFTFKKSEVANCSIDSEAKPNVNLRDQDTVNPRLPPKLKIFFANNPPWICPHGPFSRKASLQDFLFHERPHKTIATEYYIFYWKPESKERDSRDQ